MSDTERPESGRWQGLMFLQIKVLCGTFKKWRLVERNLGQIFDKFISEADLLFLFNWDLTNSIMLKIGSKERWERSVKKVFTEHTRTAFFFFFFDKIRLSAHRDEVSLYHDFDFPLRIFVTITLTAKHGTNVLGTARNSTKLLYSDNSANCFPKHEQQQL